MSATIEANAAPPSGRWLRIALFIVAGLETIRALFELLGVYTDVSIVAFATPFTTVKLAISPVIALVAFALTTIDRVRHAIVALAALTLAGSIMRLASVFVYGFAFLRDSGQLIVFPLIIFPLLAMAALILALKNESLTLAGVLATLSLVLPWLSFIVLNIIAAIMMAFSL